MIILNENADVWTFTCEDCEVQMIQIDFRLGFKIADAHDWIHVTIEQRFTLDVSDAQLTIVPEDTGTLAPILFLFNKAVSQVELTKNGHLTVEFASGEKIHVPPDDQYEAWQTGCLVGGKDCLYVCAPGGEVAQFRQEGGKGVATHQK